MVEGRQISREKRKQLLRERIVERLAALGKSPHSVSLAIDANPGYVRDLIDPDKTSIPSAMRLQALASALETTTDYLIGDAQTSAQVLSEVTLADRHVSWRAEQPRDEPGIPIVGTGDCADLEVMTDSGERIEIERSSFDPEYTVRYIERPPALRGDPSVYAIYYNGSSMIPRFFPGEIGIVQPSRPPRPGDYVLVQINDGASHDVSGVLVKRLERANTKEVVLFQHHPELTFTLPRRQVVRMHRIVPPTDALFR